MTRNDHPQRIDQVLGDAHDAAKHGVGMRGLAACVGMAPTVLRRFLTRHGRDDLVAPLLANDESLRSQGVLDFGGAA
ncbi:hypothetical protein GCM10009718_32940 [Isoptericola halotolerans]|uniref:Uncharacterized protein n=1 Tax=Isoptericola halotolerans TaxID=300560 RepID=A0ABX2A5Q1_9MICO|nr:hypothetical protein [Isoptericola halotolerans]NOV98182.1 hypothetical protein [Isoptericola halotolerans]